MISFIFRRSFLRRSSAGLTTLAAAGSLPLIPAGGEMPMRTLGKTGLRISLLGFGGGSQFLLAKDGKWEPMLEQAIASGINYFDTSSGYQWRSSKTIEERFGEILPRYRKSIYVSTKFESREPDKARAEVERSLKHMKMDYVDILLIHSIEPSEDIAALEKGVYRMLMQMKEEKLTRFIGFSSMDSSAKSKELLEKLEVDMAILAMNATKYGDFAKVALPVAREKQVGVVAMKLMRDIVQQGAKPADLLYYAWTQPGVASAVVGHVSLELLEENLRQARSFTPEKAEAFDRRGLEMKRSSGGAARSVLGASRLSRQRFCLKFPRRSWILRHPRNRGGVSKQSSQSVIIPGSWRCRRGGPCLLNPVCCRIIYPLLTTTTTVSLDDKTWADLMPRTHCVRGYAVHLYNRITSTNHRRGAGGPAADRSALGGVP